MIKVPVVVAASTSPSFAKVPPDSATVALTRSWLSGSETAAEPDSVTAAPFSVKVALAVPESVGGLLMPVRLTVVVAAVLRLFEPEPSLSTHVMVRVGSAPLSVGLELIDLNVTKSSTCW